MANTSTQQTNGALLLPSLLPYSSASQLSSVNSPGLASNQSLITQNQPGQFLQVIPPEFVPQFYQQTMFPHLIQPHTSLTLQQQNSIQLNNELAAAKKKQNKQQKIVSKASNQQILKSNNQFGTQNNQPMVISQQMSNVLSNTNQGIAAAKKFMDSQKKIQIIPNNHQLPQQAFVNSQFKPHMSGLAQQSPVLNQTQLITAPIQQIPQQQIAWAQNPIQSVQGQRIIFQQPPTHTTADVFIPNANSSLQPLYLSNNNQNVMHLVTHHPATNVQHQQQPIIHTTNHTTTTTTAQPANKLKPIKPASSQSNLNSSTQSNGSLQKAVKPMMSGEKKLSKKEQEKLNSKFLTKSTQQMNAELLALNEKNRLQRSESMKSLDSSKTKSENKQLKKQSSSQDEDSSNSMSNSGSNGSLKKSEKKVKQKAIVKPQIMTHCVDGYIIHESSFPFPVNVTEELNEELEQIKLNNNNSNSNNSSVPVINNEKVKTKKPKKFKLKSSQVQPTPIKSQPSPIQQINSTITPNPLTPNEPKNVKNDNLIETQKKSQVEPVVEEKPQPPATVKEKSNVVSVAPISESSSSLDESNVYRWSVEQVYDYLIKQDVSESIVKELRKAQIDGRSLTLLSIPILKDKFLFKLGPILTLIKKIEELKEKAQDLLDDYVPASGANIYNWSVKDTYQFILHLSSKEYAEEFERQEMDGHSLTLISTDNIVNDMNIPLGHALKIFHRIEELKKSSSK